MKIIPTVSIAAVALVATIGLAGCQSAPPEATPSLTSTASTSNVLPVDKNPIVNASVSPGLELVSAAAEDNIDPLTQQPITDRLQITLKNTSDHDLSNFDVYYSMTDISTGQSEGYYQALSGFVLKAGETQTIAFDNETKPGHYPENSFSLYRSSTNQVDFAIEVSAGGVQIARGTATKSVGTGEKAD